MRSHDPQRLAGLLAAALSTLALIAPVAGAYEITYDFTASGNFATFTGSGLAMTMGDTEEISGSVTFNVLTEAPPEDASTDGTSWAVANAGNWVKGDVIVTSSSKGTLTTGPVGADCGIDDANTGPWYAVEVLNNYLDGNGTYRSDQLLWKAYGCMSFDGLTGADSHAMVERFMYNEPPSFDGLNFSTGWLSPQYNYLYIGRNRVRFRQRGSPMPYTAEGYGSKFNIQTWTVSLAPLVAAAASLGNPGRGLAQTMNMAQAYYAAGDTQSACLMLAAFQHQASHAHGPALSQEMSDKLSADVAAVMDAIGCN